MIRQRIIVYFYEIQSYTFWKYSLKSTTQIWYNTKNCDLIIY